MSMIILILLGLCAGSFVNALVWRLHEQDELVHQPKDKPRNSKNKVKVADKSNKALTERDLSILKGRSMCVHCNHTLAWYDLIPVFSWLILGGKCRYCHKSISVQYPLVELLTAGLFASLYLLWPTSFQGRTLEIAVFAGWLVVSVVFIALFIYDFKYMLLPDVLLKILAGLSVVVALLSYLAGHIFASWWSPVVGGLLVGGFLWLMYRISDERWMGAGDGPIGLAMGILLGWKLGLLALVGSFYVGMVYVILIMLRSRKVKLKNKIPFGPFLIIATYLALIWGQQIIDWYLRVIIHA